MTLEELVYQVQFDITIGFSLDKKLPDAAIINFVENIATKWFYDYYYNATQEAFYLIPEETLQKNDFLVNKYVTLPCEIQYISWIYTVSNRNRNGIGINVPNLTINMGASSQPYLSSYATTLGDLGVYKVVIDSMADMMNQLTKFTTSFNYNRKTNQLSFLTNVKTDLVLRCYIKIPLEDLYDDHLFLRYVIANCKKMMARMYNTYNFKLAGDVTINTASLEKEADDEIVNIKEEIKQLDVPKMIIVKR